MILSSVAPGIGKMWNAEIRTSNRQYMVEVEPWKMKQNHKIIFNHLFKKIA